MTRLIVVDEANGGARTRIDHITGIEAPKLRWSRRMTAYLSTIRVAMMRRKHIEDSVTLSEISPRLTGARSLHNEIGESPLPQRQR